jgi:hypothetical protein
MYNRMPVTGGLSVRCICPRHRRNFGLPLVAICQQFLLVVKKFFSILGGVFCIGCLDNCIYRAALLAQAAVDALCHVNVVASCPS